MRLLYKVWRSWFPKSYIKRGLARSKREWKKKLEAAEPLTALERHNLDEARYHDLYEWDCWLTEIEDADLVRRARRMDVHLEDIPIPDIEPDTEQWQPPDHHWKYTSYQNIILRRECRSALRKGMRERAPNYRRERREVWELWIKAGTLAVTILTGLIGALIGLVSLLKR